MIERLSASERSLPANCVARHLHHSSCTPAFFTSLLRRYAVIAGKPLNNRVQVSTPDAAARNVAAGRGVAVLPREATEPYAQTLGLKLIALRDAWAVSASSFA